MRLLFSYLKQNKKTIALALVLATINQTFSLLDPQLFRILVDKYASHAREMERVVFLKGIALVLLGIIGVAFVSRIAKSFQDYFVTKTSRRVGTKMYSESIAHALSLPYFVFEDQQSGELLQKFDKARTDMETVIQGFVRTIFVSLIGMIFVITYSFFVHWVVGTLYLAVLPIVYFTTYFLTKRIKFIHREIVKQKTALAGATTETLRNIEVVKSLGLKDQETARLNEVNEEILLLDLKKVRMTRKLDFIKGTLINFLRSFIMFVMLYLIFTQSVTLGEFFSILFYSFFLFGPLDEFGGFISNYQEMKASLGLVEEVLEKKPEPLPANPVLIKELSMIEFRDVSFSYHSADIESAQRIAFKVKAGETVAFAGPSGSGKSTIIKLLLGLYKPTKGGIYFNRANVQEIDFNEFRKRVGYVSQETQLFAGTIRENLTFVAPQATDEECIKALTQAAALSIIERGGKGLDTRIGEGGIKISGGERQRLAIARALLRNPELIIFDEATSSLDSIAEKSITNTIQAISKLRPNLMTILVAHRLSTIAHADRIYVLEKGKIIEHGANKELLDLRGLYAALWREQSAAANESEEVPVATAW